MYDWTAIVVVILIVIAVIFFVIAVIFLMQTIFRDIIIALLIMIVTIPSVGYITGEAIDTLWGKYSGDSEDIEYRVEDGEVVIGSDAIDTNKLIDDGIDYRVEDGEVVIDSEDIDTHKLDTYK